MYSAPHLRLSYWFTIVAMMCQWICYAVGNKLELGGGGQLLLSVISPAGALSGIYVRESGEQIKREWNGKGRPTGEAERGCSSQQKVKCRDCQHFSWREKLRKDRKTGWFLFFILQKKKKKINKNITTFPINPGHRLSNSTTAMLPSAIVHLFRTTKRGRNLCNFPFMTGGGDGCWKQSDGSGLSDRY